MNHELHSSAEIPRIFPLDRPGVISAILFAQFLVVAPLFQQVSLWISITALTAIAWRLGNQYRDWPLPGRWSRLLIGMLAAAAVIMEHKALFSKEAGLSLFVVMSCLRMLELNRQRDGMNSLFLAFFLLSINFLYSQSIFMAVYAMFTAFWLIFCLNGLQSLDGIKFYKKNSSVTARIFLVTIPLTIILFLFFPRLSHPLWQMPESRTAGTGVSDSMTPGDISQLTLGQEIAFRVNFKGDAPPSNQLYWRGLVLAEFDGFTWNRGTEKSAGTIKYAGESSDYTIYIEPHRRKWLFFMDMPIKNSETPYINDRINDRFSNEIPQQLNNRMQYRGSSYVKYIAQEFLTESEAKYYLELPESGNQRSKDWALELRSKVASDEDFINQVLEYIYRNPFRYTLRPDILKEQGIDDFWFNTQNGFCEHYASNLAFLARAAGIPSRIVVGYQGGEKNPYSENWVVRQANAHAWTEIWLQGRGWLRVDPTAAIDPSRVELDAANGYRQRDLLFDESDFSEWIEDKGLMHDVRQMWDAMNSNWQKWVVDFDNESQGKMMKWAGFSDYSWSTMFRVILIATAITLLIWFLNTFAGREKFDPSVELYTRLCRKMARLNFSRKPNEGPQDFLNRIRKVHPEWEQSATPIIQNYINFRYRDKGIDNQQLKKLSKLIANIKLQA
jgi:transglutaminase-like putative cysteine protease